MHTENQLQKPKWDKARWKRENYAKNRAKILAERKQWRMDNPEKSREYNRRSRERNKHKWNYSEQDRNARLQRVYGITQDDFENMLSAQGGVCFICGGVNKKLPLAIDHCHTSGRVRRLLCNACNAAVGRLETYKNKMLSYIGVDVSGHVVQPG